MIWGRAVEVGCQIFTLQDCEEQICKNIKMEWNGKLDKKIKSNIFIRQIHGQLCLMCVCFLGKMN